MWVVAYFSDNGTPKTGLTPTLTGHDLSDNSVVLNAVAMSEVANGKYKYDFSAADNAKDYTFLADGGATLTAFDRYAPGESASAGDIAASLADTNELQTDWTNGGRLDLLIDAIIAYVDNLESRLTAARAIKLDYLDQAISSIPGGSESLESIVDVIRTELYYRIRDMAKKYSEK